jgi:hypothetical protein
MFRDDEGLLRPSRGPAVFNNGKSGCVGSICRLVAFF